MPVMISPCAIRFSQCDPAVPVPVSNGAAAILERYAVQTRGGGGSAGLAACAPVVPSRGRHHLWR